MASSAPDRCQCGPKCGTGKTRKSKFPFLRVQRSLDSGQQGCSSNSVSGARGHSAYNITAVIKDDFETCTQRRPPPARRARSAERYEGLRVNETPRIDSNRYRGHTDHSSSCNCAVTNLANMATTSHQITPPPPSIMSDSEVGGERPPSYGHSPIPPMSSPPPSYEAAMRQMNLPPSYDEYLLQKLHQLQINPKLSNTSSMSSIPSPSGTGVMCGCNTCQNGFTIRDSRREDLSNDVVTRNGTIAQRQLRVALPPESSSQDQCPCSKCQSRYGTYSYDASNDVLLSMDTATAIQGVLTDGVACNIM